MGLEEKEQMFTMGDQDLDMGEDINIGGLQIIRFEFFLFTGLFGRSHVLQMCHYDIKSCPFPDLWLQKQACTVFTRV